MRIAILDDIHEAYEGTRGVRRLRDRAEVKIFTTSFGDPSALRGFDAVVANRERTKFTRALFERLPDLRIIAQTGNYAYHIDLAAAEDRKIIVGKATGGGCTSAAELAIGLMLALLRQIPPIDGGQRAISVNNLFWKILVTRVKRKIQRRQFSCRCCGLAAVKAVAGNPEPNSAASGFPA
jgi:phosphoglycerate dehydrogenase-like enzyme